MRSRVTVAFVLLLGTASRGVAQEPPLVQPASIPSELAIALAGAGGFTNAEPQILVGAIPEWVTAKVKVPANWRVVGSAFAGTTFVGVLHIATNDDSLIAEFDRHQTPLGWKVPPPPYRPQQQGGFQFLNAPAMPTPRADQRITRCGDGQVLTAWISRTRALSTTITFRIVTSTATPQQNTTCNPFRPPVGMRDEGPRFPTLIMPAGVGNRDQACMMSRYEGRGSGTGAEVRSTMSLEQLLEHFTRQLEDSGWTRKPGAGRMISRAWTKPDSAGQPRGLSIEVQVSPADTMCRSVNLMMTDNPRSSSVILR